MFKLCLIIILLALILQPLKVNHNYSFFAFKAFLKYYYL